MFSELEGHFSFCVTKRKVPRKGWKKGDGVPPSHKAVAGQVGEAEQDRSGKSFLRVPKSNCQPSSGTDP